MIIVLFSTMILLQYNIKKNSKIKFIICVKKKDEVLIN